MKKVLLSLLLVLNILVLSSCGSPNGLTGFWVSTDGDTLNFISSNQVGMGNYNELEKDICLYHYKVSGDTVVLSLEDNGETYSLTYNYILDPKTNSLTLTDDTHRTTYYGPGYMQEEILVGLSVQKP